MGPDDATIQILIGDQYPKKVVPLIDKAKSSISVLMFDWRWYPNGLGSQVQIFNQALVRAQRRGCVVRCVVNSDDIVTTLKKVGMQAKKVNSLNLLHSKLLIIDNKIVVIGSHNISNNAFAKNFESSVVIDNEISAKEFTSYFETVWLL